MTAQSSPLLAAQDVTKTFPVRTGALLPRDRVVVHAVESVSLEVVAGETLGLVGETGCGKSTLARCLARLHDIDSGAIRFDGTDITDLPTRRMRELRRDIQMVFQDPYGSLNPRRRVGSIIGDPLVVHRLASGRQLKSTVQELMSLVGLNPEHYNRFPAEFSGGQRQRIGVARALALQPRMLICDEPVSALDVSIQAQILNLLIDLQDDRGLTYLFISHDLSVVRHVSDRVAVMYLGKIVEIAPTTELFEHTRHPYTKALLSALPVPDPDVSDSRQRIVLRGDLPAPTNPPPGCRFHTRCPKAQQICREAEPPLVPVLGDPANHSAACHFPLTPTEDLAGFGAVAPVPQELS